MSTFDFLNRFLSKKTYIFGLKLWIVIAIAVGFGIVLFLLLLPLCYSSSLRRRRRRRLPQPDSPRKSTSKVLNCSCTPPIDPTQVSGNTPLETSQLKETRIEIEKKESSSSSSGVVGGGCGGGAHQVCGGEGAAAVAGPSDVSYLSWGRWFALRELEAATGGFAEENVIGEGGYGLVYRGVLGDDTKVAVKNLLKNSAQVEKEFRMEVEAIGRVRHKNLVRLLGYCDEGENRMLVYEYVDNSNLDQWLHGDVEEATPLTWEIRMNILLGTAKGLTYLHEGLEPKVVHRDIKASNILLDRQWNPKVSDFGLAKLLCSERTYVTTRVMGTFGYVAPEYASTGMLNESSDVYSFGVLMMEMISGRLPVDYTQPSGEVHLVEWLKALVSERKYEQVLDPKMPEKPSSKALKRALLVALRCIDPDSSQRPKMGHVIHLLEMDELQYRDDYKLGREATSRRTYSDKHSMDRYSISEQEGFDRHEISFGLR